MISSEYAAIQNRINKLKQEITENKNKLMLIKVENNNKLLEIEKLKAQKDEYIRFDCERSMLEYQRRKLAAESVK